MFDIETKIGNIHFSSNIINKIAEKAVEDCGGKVMLHNYKIRYQYQSSNISNIR